MQEECEEEEEQEQYERRSEGRSRISMRGGVRFGQELRAGGARTREGASIWTK